MIKAWLRENIRKIIAKDIIWAVYDSTINRISEYSVIQKHETLKTRVKALVAKNGVLNGPFSGMRYGNRAHGSFLMPKLLGTYEMEVHSIMNDVIQNPPRIFIDVGCAEGYYAVGFALKCPDAHVLAFDIAEEARELTKELALANGVEEVYLRQLASHFGIADRVNFVGFVDDRTEIWRTNHIQVFPTRGEGGRWS